jgi:hypothetical protein
VLAQIIAFVDLGREEAKASRQPSPLTAEGVVGAVFSVIHARMLDNRSKKVTASPMSEHGPQPLVDLMGALTAIVVQPYLGHAAAQRMLDRPAPSPAPSTPRLPSDPFKDLSIRLTCRTTRVLTSIAAEPGASSKQVGAASGIGDDGQISRLLARLQKHDLIQDDGVGPTRGMPRAWSLTQRGERVLQAVGQG